MFIDQKTSKMANLPLLIYRQKTIPIEINKPILKSTWNAKDLSSQKSEKQRWKTYTVWLKLFSSSPLPFPLTYTHTQSNYFWQRCPSNSMGEKIFARNDAQMVINMKKKNWIDIDIHTASKHMKNVSHH